MKTQLADKITDQSWQLTAEGYLDSNAKISRAGVYQYVAFELGDLFPELDAFAIVPVYRPAEEVFKPASMASFALVPVTEGHPWEAVTASTHKDVAVGVAGETFMQVGDYLRGRLRLTDAEAINRVQRGDGELSAGYEADITRQTGDYQGEAYLAVMSNIMGNHIALVDAGRCGPLCRVGDRAPSRPPEKVKDCACKHKKEDEPMTTPNLIKRVFDSIPVELTEVAAGVFDKMLAQIATADAAREKAEGALAGAQATLTAKDAEIKTLKDATPDAAAMDRLATERAELFTKAKKILGDGYKPDGKTAHAIRCEAVAKVMGDKATVGKSEGYVEGLFDSCAAGVTGTGTGPGNDTTRTQFQQHRVDAAPLNDAQKAEDERNEWLRNAHKRTQAAN